MLATTDMLIGARGDGLTSNAVIGDITQPRPMPPATTWPAIRDYLVTRCGMSLGTLKSNYRVGRRDDPQAPHRAIVDAHADESDAHAESTTARHRDHW